MEVTGDDSVDTSKATVRQALSPVELGSRSTCKSLGGCISTVKYHYCQYNGHWQGTQRLKDLQLKASTPLCTVTYIDTPPKSETWRGGRAVRACH